MNQHVPATPPDMWDTQPRAGGFLVYVNSKLSAISLAVHPSRTVEDKVIVIGGDVWLRMTLRMVGWAGARIDLMNDLGNAGKITQQQYDDFGSRIDTIFEWVRQSESFTKDELDWAWFNRVAQAKFKPPFEHFKLKMLPAEKGKKP